MSFSFTSATDAHISTRRLVMLALMGALMMGGKVVMAALPNIEPVSLLLICTTLVFGIQSLYSAAIYILLEGIFYGFGIWWFSYLYLWPILVLSVLLVKRTKSYFFLTLNAALFGLFFGMLCAIPYLFAGGFAAGFTYWISGIPFDLLHCVGNAVMSALLLRPLHKLTAKLAGVPLWAVRKN